MKHFLERYGFYLSAAIYFSVFAYLKSQGFSIFGVFFSMSCLSFAFCLFFERMIPVHSNSFREGEILDDVVGVLFDRFVTAAIGGGLFTLISLGLDEAMVYSPNITENWSPWLSYPLLVCVIEFGTYWAHRILHSNAFFWKGHAMHHATDKMWFLDQYHRHPYGASMLIVCSVPLPFFLGMDQDFLYFRAAFGIFISGYQHVNADFKLGLLNYIFNCSPSHQFHHSVKPSEANTNYGSVILLWDQVFATFTNPRTVPSPSEIGLFKLGYDDYPLSGYFKQLIAPHRPAYWVRNTDGKASEGTGPVGQLPGPVGGVLQ